MIGNKLFPATWAGLRILLCTERLCWRISIGSFDRLSVESIGTNISVSCLWVSKYSDRKAQGKKPENLKPEHDLFQEDVLEWKKIAMVSIWPLQYFMWLRRPSQLLIMLQAAQIVMPRWAEIGTDSWKCRWIWLLSTRRYHRTTRKLQIEKGKWSNAQTSSYWWCSLDPMTGIVISQQMLPQGRQDWLFPNWSDTARCGDRMRSKFPRLDGDKCSHCVQKMGSCWLEGRVVVVTLSYDRKTGWSVNVLWPFIPN